MGVCLSLSACPYSARVSKTAGKRLRAALPTDPVQPFNPRSNASVPVSSLRPESRSPPAPQRCAARDSDDSILTPRRHLEGTGRRLRSPHRVFREVERRNRHCGYEISCRKRTKSDGSPGPTIFGRLDENGEGGQELFILDGDDDCAFCDGNEKTKLARLGGARPIQSASPGSSVRYLPDLLS